MSSVADRLWLARRFFDLTKIGIEQRTAIAIKKEYRLQAACQKEGKDRSHYDNIFRPDACMYANAALSVNFAQGLEILLKALRFENKGWDKHGHRLRDIYSDLSASIQEELEREFSHRCDKNKIASSSFKTIIETCDKLGLADGTMKYLYEILDKREGFSFLPLTTLYRLSNVMIQIMENRTLFPPEGYRFED